MQHCSRWESAMLKQYGWDNGAVGLLFPVREYLPVLTCHF